LENNCLRLQRRTSTLFNYSWITNQLHSTVGSVSLKIGLIDSSDSFYNQYTVHFCGNITTLVIPYSLFIYFFSYLQDWQEFGTTEIRNFDQGISLDFVLYFVILLMVCIFCLFTKKRQPPDLQNTG